MITINEAGVVHLKNSLASLHKKYAKMDENNINHWVSMVEDNYRDGKGATIEIKAHESTTGKPEIISFGKNFYNFG
jgi:hypothetical protein